MQPLVSVVIPCYNQAKYLRSAIDSVLGQTYRYVEIIAIDDGSTDDTPDVIGAYKGKIRSVRQANAGLSAARNTGLALATGEFVLFLDSDDALFVDTIEKHVSAIARFPEGSVFYGGCVSVDAEGRELTRVMPKDLPCDALPSLLAANRLSVLNVVVRRQAVHDIGGFDPALVECGDWDCWIRLASAGHRFVAVPGAWAAYRRHPASMSASYGRMLRGGLQVVAKHRGLARKNWQTRWAHACGARSVRYYAAQTALLPKLRDSFHRGGRAAAFRGLASAVFEDKDSLQFFLLEYWCIGLARLLHRTVRREPAPQ